MESKAKKSGRLRSPLTWTLIFAALAAYPLFSLLTDDLLRLQADAKKAPKPPLAQQEYFTIPEFKLMNQEGQPFGTEQLKGKLWVANFFFTTCPTICKELTQRMLQLQARFDEKKIDALLVSFTVDPKTDTPAVLKKYGQDYGAKPERWTMLTGEPALVRSTIVSGFKQPMGEKPDPKVDDEGVLMNIAHSVRLVVVDGERKVLGLYDANDQGLERLVRDLEARK